MDNSIIQNTNNYVVFEGMTCISALIRALDTNSNSRKIIEILFDENKISSKRRELAFLRAKSAQHNFKLTLVPQTTIDDITDGNTHGGIIAICSQKSIPHLSTGLINSNGVYYMFEGVEDPYNFGYMIRSVYAAGADGIIMPPRNWLSATSVVARSSAGTLELIDMFISDPNEAIDIFKQLGFKIVCAGIRDSENVYDADLKQPLLVVIGGEKRGISRSILAKADEIVRIDYGREFLGSLPSVAATSIISFEILRKNKTN